MEEFSESDEEFAEFPERFVEEIMPNGEYGRGRVTRINRPLGVGVIEPDSGGPPVLFTPEAVQGGADGFQKLRRGDSVSYHPAPGKIGEVDFADDVMLGGSSKKRKSGKAG